jgi:hypothetical protein
MFQNLQLTKQNFIDSKWQLLIDPESESGCYQYSRILKSKADEITDENSPTKEIFILFSVICSFSLVLDSSSPFQARCSFADGRRSAIPEDIPEQYWEMLNDISTEIHNAEIRARVCDLLWTYKRKYQLIKPAIEEYLKASEVYLSLKSNAIIDSISLIRRALALCGYDRSQKEALINFIKTQIENDKYKKKEYPVVFLRLIEILTELSADGLETYVQDMEDLAETASNTLIEEGFYRAIHNLLPKDNYKFQNSFYKIKAAQTYIKEADKAIKREVPSYMAASKFLMEAIEALNKEKTPLNEIDIDQQVKDLKSKLAIYQETIPSELKKFSMEFDISEQVQKVKEHVSNKSIHDALFSLTQTINIRDEAYYRETALKNAREHPLMFLFQASQLNSNGQTVGVVPQLFSFSGNEINQDSLKFHSFFYLNIDLMAICSGSIQPAIHQINLEHKVDLNTFLEIVQNNPFVEPGRELIYAKGLLAGFSQDFITSTHLLIPQFENSIRYILQHYGEITTKLDDSRGFEKEMSLNELFFNKRTVLEKVFHKNQLFVLEYLLVHPLGANLRNLFAHGLFQSGQFYSSDSLYLWALILQLIYFPLIKRE